MFYCHCFRNSQAELLLIVTPEPEEVRMQISAAVNMDNVRFLECETNDTWARDHGAITMVDTEGASLLDFTFNGWGLKFASDKDNQITRRAVEAEILKGRYMSRLGFVLKAVPLKVTAWEHYLPLRNACCRLTVTVS